MAVMISNIQKEINLAPQLEEKLKKLAVYLMEKEGFSPEMETNIVLVNDKYMTDLNKTYRSREGTTDVLSFNLQDDDIPWDSEVDEILGDVYISVEKAREQGKERLVTIEEEILFLASHGLLHLMGYVHDSPEEESFMQAKQQDALSFLQQGG